jgi:hypothetical protein
MKNKIRMTQNANYSTVGLNSTEKASLWAARKQIGFDIATMERERENIICNYDAEINEVFFVPIVNGWERNLNNVEFVWSEH